MSTLHGNVVVITGASSGIGAATSIACAREGARVVLAARRQARLEQVAAEVRHAGGEALVVPTDITDQSAIAELSQRVMEHWGRIDVLINNAARGLVAPFEQTSAQELQDLLGTNVVSSLMMIQAVLPIMRRQGSGHLITISSIAGRHGTRYRAAYSATKFALGGLIESLRQELRGTGIQTSLIYPVTTETEFFDAEVKKIHLPHSGPVQSPQQVAQAIVRCIKRPRAEVYTHPFGYPLAVLTALAPQLVDALADASRSSKTSEHAKPRAASDDSGDRCAMEQERRSHVQTDARS